MRRWHTHGVRIKMVVVLHFSLHRSTLLRPVARETLPIRQLDPVVLDFNKALLDVVCSNHALCLEMTRLTTVVAVKRLPLLSQTISAKAVDIVYI